MSKTILPILLLGLALLGWSGCASDSAPPLSLPSDPQTAPQAELESLYEQLTLRMAGVKAGSDEAVRVGSQLRTVGKELAERSAARVRTRISEVERVDGRLPLGALERELGGLDAIRRWDANVHAALSRELEQEADASRRAMQKREEALERLGADDLLARLKILSELSGLSGTGSAEQARYASQRDELLREVSKEAEEAIENEEYEKAADLLGIVQEVDPGDEQARKKKCEVDGQVILKRFGKALETGRVDRTMTLLTDFSETDCFAEIKDGLAESAAPMAEAFGLLGQEATNANDLETAYQRYQDSQVIQELLLERKQALPGLDAFLKKVEAAHEKAFEAGEYGLAWGYLNVMTELGPTTPHLRQRIRMTKDEIGRRAVRGLTAYPFSDPPTSASSSSAKVGDAVASKVVQHIFQTIPSDVRIVEREQLERILEECKRVGRCEDLDTADFIVQGSILDAKVETTEKSGSETRRVVTGQETIVNPDHTRWSQMREKERKNTPEPPRTITRDVTEDVSIEVTQVRKVGIISVSYRVVEANSGRVLFTDSIQTKQEFQDEGRQGVQLGNFEQATDFVELPPDIEILSGAGGLADQISEAIGTKLVEFLQNPEDQYATEAKRFVGEGDFIGAARKAAYAIILCESKDKEMGTLPDDLKSYAMSSPKL